MIRTAVFSFLLMCSQSQAIAVFDETLWSNSSAVDHCRLTLTDNRKSFVVSFEKYGGEYVTSSVRTKQQDDLSAGGTLSSVPPQWSLSTQYSPIALSMRPLSNKPTVVKNTQSHKAINSLIEQVRAGYWLSFVTPTKSATLPTVNSKKPINDFRLCIDSLPPISLAAASNANIFFASSLSDLTQSNKDLIASISSLVKRDKRITKILLDGYSDSNGHRFKNLQLSKLRTDNTALEFVKNGISIDMLERRSHGDRYPSMTGNSGVKNNRRVNIRLVVNYDT